MRSLFVILFIESLPVFQISPKIAKSYAAKVMKCLRLLLLIVVTQVLPATAMTWFPYQGHEYAITPDLVTWQGAETEALAVGGYLATINDAAEENWIKSTFGSQPAFWIGLNDAAREGVFVWVNGESAGYRNWELGQPKGSRGDNSVYLDWSVSGRWKNVSSQRSSPGIIERNGAVSVPEHLGWWPVTFVLLFVCFLASPPPILSKFINFCRPKNQK